MVVAFCRFESPRCPRIIQRVVVAALSFVIASLGVTLTRPAVAQVERPFGFRPACYAITGATIVPKPGTVVAGGTVVVRDGMIVAIGRDVTVPPDADIVPGDGLFVYAGFIDAGTSDLIDPDHKATPAAGRSTDFSRSVMAAMAEDSRNGLTPELRASAILKLRDDLLDQCRQNGIVAAHVVPSGRIASGVGCLVSLGGLPVRESLLDEATMQSLHLAAPGGRGTYPSTLMGAFAHLRQAFHDADRHALQSKLFRDGVPNVPRPAVDPTWDALLELHGDRRALFAVTTRDDVDRALTFAAEVKLRAILWGGRDAHRALLPAPFGLAPTTGAMPTALREQGTQASDVSGTPTQSGGHASRSITPLSLLLPVDFGDEPKVDPPKPSKELVTDAKDPLEVQEHRRDEWKTRVGSVAKLHHRGVKFAFSSRGLSNRADFLKGVRQAIAAGLPTDVALAGLTTDAASILGHNNDLGTLTVGRPAALVAMTGPFDDPQSKVKHVLVDGRRFDYAKDAKPLALVAVAEVPGGSEREKNPVTIGLDTGAGSDAPAGPAVAEIPGIPLPLQLDAKRRPVELPADRLRRPLATGGNALIRGGTVLTGTGQTLPNTSILVRAGKIAALGANLAPDAGMAVIDATGRFVMPGIIDTHSHIMITGGINEATQSIVCEVRIRDVINTDDVSEYRALAGGVTAARIFHGSANVIGGQDAVVKLKYGLPASQQILHDAPQGVKFALGENVKFQTSRFPNSRLGVEATLNRAFFEGIDYRRKWQQHNVALSLRDRKAERAGDVDVNDPKAAARASGTRLTERDGNRVDAGKAPPLLPPRRDLRLETLADIVNHQKFIHSHCYRADEILMLLNVAQNVGVRVWSLQHVLEGYKVAPEIVAHGASCSTFADWWAYKVEAFDATPWNAALLAEAGANTVIKSDDWELIRHLYHEASKTIRYGDMPPDKALQAITLNPARELGLDARIGSIEVGKDADLGIYSAHPFNTFARCEMTLIEGEVYFSRVDAPSAMLPASALASTRPAPWSLPDPAVRRKTVDMTPSLSGRYAFVNAAIHPVDAPDIPRGTLLVDGEKIAAVGSSVDIPADAKVIDAEGLHLYPGLIDAGTTLGLVEIGKVKETHDEAETGTFQPDLRAGIAINPDSELIPVARLGGVTAILVRPTGGVVAGQASLAKLCGWTAPQMVLDYTAGLQIIWPTGGDAAKQQEQLRNLLEDARLYEAARGEARPNPDLAPIPDPRYEALRPYVRGEKPVFIEADTRKAIAEALLFAEKEKLRPIITGGADAWLLADELKRRDVPVIVGPVMRAPVSEHDPFDAPYANPGRLHAAGVKFAIRSNNAANSRNAPFEAGMAAAYGLPEDAALRAVTLSAAEILGQGSRLGSLSPGKQATLLVTDGSPLQATTQIKAVYIDGQPCEMQSRQRRFYERYRQRLANGPAAAVPREIERPAR